MWTLVVGATAAAGCGTNQPSLKGTVTFDGEPVAAGGILFFPLDSGGKGASAPVLDGKYEIPGELGPTPGKHRVEVRWAKKTGREKESADPGVKTDELKEAIPAKFNAESTLTTEITAGENVKDFNLTTK